MFRDENKNHEYDGSSHNTEFHSLGTGSSTGKLASDKKLEPGHQEVCYLSRKE